MNLLPWIVLFLLAVISVAGWAIRLWIKQSVERSVQARYERELETVRSDLRLKEAKITGLQNNALGGLAARQALLGKRRLEATERLWRATLDLGVFKAAATTMTMLKIDKVAERTPREENLRQFLQMMKGGELKSRLNDNSAALERPFVAPGVWAVFSAYRAVLVSCYVYLEILSTGIEDATSMFREDKLIETVKAVLPTYSDYLDERRLSGVALLVDTIEEKLLELIRHSMSDTASDEEGAAQTARILKLVNELNLTPEKQLPSAEEGD